VGSLVSRRQPRLHSRPCELRESSGRSAYGRNARQRRGHREGCRLIVRSCLDPHHPIEAPDIRYRDSLSEGASEDAEKYTLILANPPFAGSLDYESTSKNLQRIVKTKKTELLFLALFLKLLKPGGRAAVIVPDGVLFGSSKAHKDLRRTLIEEQKLDAVVKLPSGVFRPYAGVSTAILLFTKTASGGTEEVWFYDVRADGFSLDDKRNPVQANDLPDTCKPSTSIH
jgi:type I restriction enzyme M protein